MSKHVFESYLTEGDLLRVDLSLPMIAMLKKFINYNMMKGRRSVGIWTLRWRELPTRRLIIFICGLSTFSPDVHHHNCISDR